MPMHIVIENENDNDISKDFLSVSPSLPEGNSIQSSLHQRLLNLPESETNSSLKTSRNGSLKQQPSPKQSFAEIDEPQIDVTKQEVEPLSLSAEGMVPIFETNKTAPNSNQINLPLTPSQETNQQDS